MDSSEDAPRYLIVGATGGIGSALCRQLADTHARLSIVARSEDDLSALAEEVGAERYDVLDATDFEQVEKLVDAVSDDLGGLDGAVNLVGSILLKPAHRTSFEEFQRTIELNLTSAFAVTRAAAGKMMRDGGGSIVLASSATAQLGIPNHEAIAAAKGGVAALARGAAASYARRGVRVNAVSPGLVRTPMTESITANDQSLEYSLEMHGLDRIGEPDDIASSIRWLLDPANDWVTGQVLGVDGGLGSVKTAPSS